MRLTTIVLCGCLWLGPANAGAFDDYFRALMFDQPQVIEALADKGFDINTRDEKLNPSLHQAIIHQSQKTALMLANRPDLDINAANAEGETALMLAAIRGNLPVFEAILKRDPVINTGGWTVMHYVMSNPNPEGLAMAKLLMPFEPDLDAPSPNKTTPLMMAAKYGSALQVKWLLEFGADPNVTNEQGLNAWAFAKASDRVEHRRILEAFMKGQPTIQ